MKIFNILFLSDEKRELHHLDLNTYRSSDYDKLALSLISPLPNEQDFAINVCTLLSNDNRHNLKLERHPRIVTYLLAHAGIFNHSKFPIIFAVFLMYSANVLYYRRSSATVCSSIQ